MTQRPPVFGKGDLCLALTGKTNYELLGVISSSFIRPIAHAPGDIPRSEADRLVDGFDLFSQTYFGFHFLPKPVQEHFEAFQKFRDYERGIHPRESYPLHAQYWDPTYVNIESAYKCEDHQQFLEGLGDLVNRIIHD